MDSYSKYRLIPMLREQLLMDMVTHHRLRATWTSARFAQDNMLGAKVCWTREEMAELAVSLASQPGLFAEFGVFEGRSINWIAARTDRTVHGFDSFEGLPEDWTPEAPAGEFAKPPGWLPKVAPNVKLHVGLFDRTLPRFVKEHPEDVSLLHIDSDLYSSARTVFHYLGPRLQPGCVILFDEYFNQPDWEAHEFKAFQEFVRETGRQYEYVAYRRNGTQVCLRMK
jgi:hypothetical protein